MVDLNIGGDQSGSSWNIVPSMSDQAMTMSALAASMAQDNLSQTPALPDAEKAKPTILDKLFDKSGDNALQKINQNIVTRAIANQGQLLPIPTTTKNSTGSDEDIKKLIAKLSGGGTANSAPAPASNPSQGSGSGAAGVIGDVLKIGASFVGWIICTELYRQGKMPRSWYLAGGPVFASYSEIGKRGYYLWAIPCVRHMRRCPDSRFTKFLEVIFRWRAEDIAASRGVKNTRKLWRGKFVTAILYPSCHVFGAILWLLGKDMNWMQLYGAET